MRGEARFSGPVGLKCGSLAESFVAMLAAMDERRRA
jgi:hypothetical protein